MSDYKYKTVYTNRKTIGIRVLKDATIVIRLPYILKKHPQVVQEVLNKNSVWINKKVKQAEDINNYSFKQNLINNGYKVLYLGEKYIVNIVDEANQKEALIFNNKQFYLLSKYFNDDYIGKVFKIWYQNQAFDFIKTRTEFYANKYNLTYNSFNISKNNNTSWGTCNNKKDVRINFKLIMSPIWVIDYVIVHELAHLKYLNHKKEFWDFVNYMYPNYIKAKKWLKENASKLQV